jgi:hypothetical protein
MRCTGSGRAFAAWLKPRRVAVGRDIRHSSEEFANALTSGLTESGVDVVDIGLCGTECVYFATSSLELDGGIMVTASHNPPDYNGLKFVREQAKPVSGDTGLQEIRRIAETGEFVNPARAGRVEAVDVRAAWRGHVLSYVDAAKLRPAVDRLQRGQRRGGRLRRPPRGQPAVPHHEDPPRGGRRLPERRAKPDDRGEPRGDCAPRAPVARGPGHRLRR